MDVKQTNEIKEIEIYIDLSSMTLEKDFKISSVNIPYLAHRW